MTLWSDIAEWRGPVLHHSNQPISDHMYVVIHTADGSYEGTIAWQKDPAADNSSHFVVRGDGHIAQVNDTAIRSGAQIGGNAYSIAIENAGNGGTPLTAGQIEANARILAKAHLVHGIPLQLTGTVGRRGLGHHSMGAESGANWGHSACPGPIIKSQKQAILDRAVAIVAAATAPPSEILPIGETDVIYQVTSVPPGVKDVMGNAVPENGQCLATPNGPFNLTGSEFFSLPAAAQPVRIKMTWARLEGLCLALRTPPAA
jgi:N-acetylmuramoyl-L-alanine amidase-like protein